MERTLQFLNQTFKLKPAVGADPERFDQSIALVEQRIRELGAQAHGAQAHGATLEKQVLSVLLKMADELVQLRAEHQEFRSEVERRTDLLLEIVDSAQLPGLSTGLFEVPAAGSTNGHSLVGSESVEHQN
jgi:hypothetical protein